MKTTYLLPTLLITAMISLSACGAWWLPRPHRIDIQQGNLLSTESVEQIEVGMSRNEVVQLLGQPLAVNQLNPNRFDYIFSINRSGEKPNVKRLSVDFQNGVVSAIDTHGIADTTEADQ